jgi:REP element-mobilizing transposase RayT
VASLRGVPHPCAARVGVLFLLFCRPVYTAQVPKGLKRYYGQRHLHFITFSCYRRLPILGTGSRRTAFLRILEEVRISYCFKVVGYVVMPEHVHLLIGEPDRADPSTVMQVLKQRFARRIRPRRRQNIMVGQGELWPWTPPMEKLCGSGASTTSMSGVRPSAPKSCVICTIIPLSADW